MRVWAEIIDSTKYGYNPQQRLCSMSQVDNPQKGSVSPLHRKEQAQVISQDQAPH